jgi:sporulation protein YlmC with PRC-barrel domain
VKDARVSELIGKRVVSPSGDDLGEIEDLLATGDRDRPPTVVVSVGGVLDVGDKWYATSFDELLVSAESDTFVLDKTEDELAKEPPSCAYSACAVGAREGGRRWTADRAGAADFSTGARRRSVPFRA